MNYFDFLFDAFVGGFYDLIKKEMFYSYRYSLPTLVISCVVGITVHYLLSRWIRNKLIIYCIVGGVVAAITAVFRFAIVFGAYVSLMTEVNCFTIRTLSDTTYLLFALSGMVAGLVIALKMTDESSTGQTWLTLIGSLGIALGVLYHLEVAQVNTVRLFPRLILLLGEFLAPAIFALVFMSIVQALKKRWA